MKDKKKGKDGCVRSRDKRRGGTGWGEERDESKEREGERGRGRLHSWPQEGLARPRLSERGAWLAVSTSTGRKGIRLPSLHQTLPPSVPDIQSIFSPFLIRTNELCCQVTGWGNCAYTLQHTAPLQWHPATFRTLHSQWNHFINSTPSPGGFSKF